jgi:pimeloyl-ACP methyl ester carboxylesterase
MHVMWRRLGRRPLGAAVAGGALVLALACGCNPSTSVVPEVELAICTMNAHTSCPEQDFINQTTMPGDFQSVGTPQSFVLRAVDHTTHHALANLQLQAAVTGVNGGASIQAQPAPLRTDNRGMVALTYTGTQAGTDLIRVSTTSGKTVTAQATVHWLQSLGTIHPIIFLHGINESANDIAQRLYWSPVLDALSLTYDPSFIEAFCYVDDKVYVSGPVPAHCPAPGHTACVTNCRSQSHVLDNAYELAARVLDLYGRSGHQPVTLMGYSMGSSIIRDFLAGCPAEAAPYPQDFRCTVAASVVDKAFFFNGVQQGSWLMTVSSGLNSPYNLTGDGITAAAISPFASVLPTLDQLILSQVRTHMDGLDGTSPAAMDLTPQSGNITAHNAYPLPNNVKAYTFYGAIQLKIGVDLLGYHLPGTQALPLGDLALLAQSDGEALTPEWGGASLCNQCGPLSANFHKSITGDQYHAWALADNYDVNLADIIPGIGKTFQAVFNSPVWHLNVSHPAAEAPGSVIQLADFSGHAASPSTDLAEEVLLILKFE